MLTQDVRRGWNRTRNRPSGGHYCVRICTLKLKAAWSLLETVSAGLFCQLITIPLFKDHKILVQVAGHANPTIKLLPALIITESNCEWIERSFDAVIADSHRVPAAVWSLGKTLADHALKARSAK